MTLVVMVIVLALGFSFSFSSAINLRMARNDRQALRLRAGRRSCLAHAMATLSAKGAKDTPDTLQDKWAADDNEVTVDKTVFTVRIVDEDRKLNLNRAALPPAAVKTDPDLRQTLRRLIHKAGGKERDFDLITQWLDPDKVAHDVENAPRQPLPFVDYLSSVTSLTPGLLNESVGETRLRDLLSTHPRRININTADPEVLQALWNDPDLVQALLDRRETSALQSESDISAFFESAKAPHSIKATLMAFDVKSEFFTITVFPKDSPQSRGLWALVERDGSSVRALYVRRVFKEGSP